MVFLVSGLSWTPPPLMALPTPVGPAAVLADDVEVAGADDRRRPDRMDGSEAVRVGYRCATCGSERRILLLVPAAGKREPRTWHTKPVTSLSCSSSPLAPPSPS